jgi:diacylglycerol O-acyltransferase
MDRLSPLDAAFLDAEDADRHTSMAIASIAIFDGSPPDPDELLAALTARLPSIPRYRQRVRRLPLDLAPPAWVDDPAFDITFHVRRTALPAPGDDHELFALMARLMGQRLDRDRPLWEMWIVEGLSGGCWAVVSKVHHCMVDGISGTELYHLLLSSSPEWTSEHFGVAELPAPHVSRLADAARTLYDIAAAPFSPVRLAASAVRHPRVLAGRSMQTAQGLAAAAGVMRPTPVTHLTGPVGQQRVYVADAVPLSKVKAIASAFNVTVNDVVLAAAAGGYRTVLQVKGDRCDARAVRSLVPVSVRAPGSEGELANRVSCMFADLPVDLADPLDRLTAVHQQVQNAKDRHEAEAGEVLVELSSYSPFPVISAVLRAAFHVRQRNIVTVTTNVPGPRQPLFLMGRRLRRLLPYVPIADRVRSGVAILSYCDELAFGVTTDRDSGIDGALILRGINADIDALHRSSQQRLAGLGVDRLQSVGENT